MSNFHKSKKFDLQDMFLFLNDTSRYLDDTYQQNLNLKQKQKTNAYLRSISGRTRINKVNS